MKFVSGIEKSFEKLEKLAQFLLLIYIAECTVGGSGRWLEIGPFSIRMVLFAICFFVTLPIVCRSFKLMITSFQIVISVCFGIYLLIGAWIGIQAGNQTGFIWSDLSSFMSLALIPGFMLVMGNRQAITRAMSVVFWSSLLLSCITIVLHFVFAFDDGYLVNHVNSWINQHSMGGLASLQTGLQRIYLKSHIFLQIAVIYGVWMIRNCDNRRRMLLLILCDGILLFSWLITYTRGFWLGLAVTAVCVLIFDFRSWKKLVAIVGGVLSTLLALILLSTAIYRAPVVAIEVINRFSPELLVSYVNNNEGNTDSSPSSDKNDISDTGDNTSDVTNVDKANQAAVNLRASSLSLIYKKIKESPILGSGLGANLDSIRNDGRTEYMYLDIWMKTGCIGLVLFILTYFGFMGYQVYGWWKHRRALDSISEDCIRNKYLTAAYIGMVVTNIFNPFLNNPMGITVLMLTSTAIFSVKKQKINKEN